MNHSPDLIIATTIRRYLQPPSDKEFWKEYVKIKEKSPKKMMELLENFISIEEIKQRKMQEGDTLLVDYILDLNGHANFPLNPTLAKYIKEHFTPDDNDFYNRVIYENEIRWLKEEIEILKIKAKDAIEAKKSFIQRDYQFIKQIGSGGFGTVSLVKHTVSN